MCRADRSRDFIIIPDTAKEKPLQGEIVAVGNGTKDEEMILKVGDTVLYGKYSDMTKIIIAQRITSVMEADEILVMDNGCVKGFGTHEELLKTCPLYKEIFDIQISKEVG